jgi:hypothetical protein
MNSKPDKESDDCDDIVFLSEIIRISIVDLFIVQPCEFVRIPIEVGTYIVGWLSDQEIDGVLVPVYDVRSRSDGIRQIVAMIL